MQSVLFFNAPFPVIALIAGLVGLLSRVVFPDQVSMMKGKGCGDNEKENGQNCEGEL